MDANSQKVRQDSYLVSVDDIIETLNGFRAIDYLIDVALEPLSEDIIKHIHYILKQGTKESWIEGYPIGEYKKESNTARGNETYAPSEVPDAMKNMISDYVIKENKTIEDKSLKRNQAIDDFL